MGLDRDESDGWAWWPRFVVAMVMALTGLALAPLPARPGSPAWAPVASMTTPRAFSAAAVATGLDGRPRIYVIGGTTHATSVLGAWQVYDPSPAALASAEAYDPASGTWETLPTTMPTPRRALGATTGPDGRIYAVGGSTGGGPTGAAEAYDPRTGTWSALPPLATPRYALAAVAGPDGRIYAIGGYTSAGPTAAVEAYRPGESSWEPAPAMAIPRGGLAAVTAPDGRIYAMGGTGWQTVEAYDVTTASWTPAAPMSTPRHAHAAAMGPDGRIYAIGGCDGPTRAASVEAFDLATGRWEEVGYMSVPRDGPAAATGPDGRVYAIGGIDVYASPGPRSDAMATAEAHTPTG